MDLAVLRAERLRSHRLTAPAAEVGAAASHLVATQAQEFWGGRWALALRTRGTPALSVIDRAFETGDLVRSWTMRGTLHLVAARDLGWLLGLTGERQLRAAGARHRGLGIDDAMLARVERAVRSALAGGGRMTRADLFDLFRGLGIDPAAQRGVHLLYALAVRQVVVQGPVVPREGGPTREQWFVLAEEWVTDAASPADPLAELTVRYVDGHGPAGPADLAWWSGLPLGVARTAFAAASADLVEVDEGLFVTRPRPRRDPRAAEVVALPPYDEYFLSYADRTVSCPPDLLPQLALGGVMRPMLVAGGEVVGWWSRGTSAGGPSGEIAEPGAVTDDEASAALDRFRVFLTG